VKHFPQWCDELYRASFVTIDQSIRRRQHYPALRRGLLKWVAGLARYRPKRLKWDSVLLSYFSESDSPDDGVPAWDITTIVFTDSWDCGKNFPAMWFCEYCQTSFLEQTASAKAALLR
jgi:hypothetical protein